MTDIQKALFSMADEGYKKFNSALIPTVDPKTVIGVRTPELRKYAREIAKTPDAAEFLRTLPHTYYEENNLHAYIIEGIKDFGEALSETERFLPYIDNWATCDTFTPKAFKKRPEELLVKIREWLGSGHTYTVRYAMGLLMSLYLDEAFTPEYPALVAAVESEEYYINMMIAWYFATALAKQKDAALPYLTERRLSPWVHNKTIQKAVESNRIDGEFKTYLKSLKIK